MNTIIANPKHLLLAPLYWRQGREVKKNTPRLPEALPMEKKARQGTLPFIRNYINEQDLSNSVNSGIDSTIGSPRLGHDKLPYRLMIIGDSSAAGVGVTYQSQALLGQLLLHLFHSNRMCSQYHSISWKLRATTGHNSFDILRELYLLPTSDNPLDLMIIVVGVNDATQMQSLITWQNNLNEILTVTKHKFQPKHVIFTALPPMIQFPAMPYPLNEFIGEKSAQLDQYLQDFCGLHEHLHYVDFTIPVNPKYAKADYFASDGFHPSGLTYQLWAERLSQVIVDFS